MSIMALVLTAAAAALAALGVVVARELHAKQARLVALEHALVDCLAAEREASIRHEALVEQQDIAEKSVETGAKSAETIHRTVAGVTFGILDSIPATENVSRLVRGVHDGVAGTVYASVRDTNKQLGKLARGYLKEREAAARRQRPGNKPGDKSGDDDDKAPGGGEDTSDR